MEYIRSCSNNQVLRSSAAATAKAKEGGTIVIVIGHGTHEGIARYKEMSGCAFDMYSDEDKNIYKALGLTRRFLGSTEDTKRASYIGEGKSSLSITAYSAYKMIASGSLAFKGGDFALLGGEFVLDKGEGGGSWPQWKMFKLTGILTDSRCVFAHRMRDTTDHTQVEELAKYADIDRKE
jgi:hypothetical protein